MHVGVRLVMVVVRCFHLSDPCEVYPAHGKLAPECLGGHVPVSARCHLGGTRSCSRGDSSRERPRQIVSIPCTPSNRHMMVPVPCIPSCGDFVPCPVKVGKTSCVTFCLVSMNEVPPIPVLPSVYFFFSSANHLWVRSHSEGGLCIPHYLCVAGLSPIFALQ